MSATAPAPLTTWRKHWPQTSHGRRYTYGVLRVEAGVVHWRRSDGLHGSTRVDDWEQYAPAGKPAPGWREIRYTLGGRRV